MVSRRGSKGKGAAEKEASADSSSQNAAEKCNDPGPASAKVKEEPSAVTAEEETSDPPVAVADPTATEADLSAARDSDPKEEQYDWPQEFSGKNTSLVKGGAGEEERTEAGEGPQAALPEMETEAEVETVANVEKTIVEPQSSSGAVEGSKAELTPPRESQSAQGDDAEGVQAEEAPVEEGESSSSDDEDGDGFRVVVGREAAPPVAPAAPVKRFLRGTNTLVNNTTVTSGGAESRGPTASAKPVSAAAGIASLVPSKGAPVAAARPSLKPGEYPPTAELQSESGKTAFDVDIDGMEEQPWRHPGVDIADFFNYGFTEDPWRVYCEKQLRNRYDQTQGRLKNAKGNSLRVGGGSHMRHGPGGGMRRGGGRLGGQERSAQFHSNGPDRSRFSSHGPPPGNAWGPGQGQEQFPPHGGFGSGPPPGASRGNSPPPWFDGSQQMHPGNRQKNGVGPVGGQCRGGPAGGQGRRGLAGGQGRGGPVGGQGRGGVGVEREGAMGGRRGRSPGPRDGPSDKIPRIR